MPGSRIIRTGLAAASAASVAAALAATAAAQTARIVARPATVMAGSSTTLTGAGFAPGAQLSLRECGRRFWLAPEQPCNTANAISVTANRYGRFRIAYHVELCPVGEPGQGPNERICFIGVLHTGEDTGALEPAARLVVSYP